MHKAEKRFTCAKEGCGKLFAIEADLNMHLKSCIEGSFSCRCGKVFTRKGALLDHIRTGETHMAGAHAIVENPGELVTVSGADQQVAPYLEYVPAEGETVSEDGAAPQPGAEYSTAYAMQQSASEDYQHQEAAVAGVAYSEQQAYGETQAYSEATSYRQQQPYSEGTSDSASQPYSSTPAYTEQQQGYTQPYSEPTAYSEPTTYSEPTAYSEPTTYSEPQAYSEPQVYSEQQTYSEPQAYSEPQTSAEGEPHQVVAYETSQQQETSTTEQSF